MTKPLILLGFAALIGATGIASAQNAPADTTEQRLERIEHKLDAILRRLDEPATIDAGQTTAPAVQATQKSATSQKAGAVPAAAGTDSTSYKPGAVAIARIAPAKTDALSDIPADSVGSYVYQGGAIPLSELSRNGVRYTGLAAVELQGWLKIAQPGRTQLAVEYRATTGSNVFIDPTCIASVWLEDRSIGSRRGEIPMPAREEQTVSLVYGADLQPGLYKLRAWLACTPPRDLRRLSAVMLIKSPSDMNLRLINDTELLHQGG
ncbi:hypothetical protein LB543_24345 [Mesorhizobium sp. ESP7-2]|uniref:hypothetical protein n=1 Tax=Mesorhizobium sp. ESP7-2 TaxID=2876622 RepID=UPI001CCA1467|nr:hypothetical protein [Mesorhizobium sp. ESP7-2]MBZ9709842.1 hypothetical protein [Mesorhizobium sp. ESP7-2]